MSILNNDEVKFLITQIKSQISSIENVYLQEVMSFTNKSKDEETEKTDEWLKQRINDLYLKIKVYFEHKQLFKYLENFIVETEKIIK